MKEIFQMRGVHMKYTKYFYLILFIVIINCHFIPKNSQVPVHKIYYDHFQYTDNVSFYGVDGLNIQYEGDLAYLGDSYELSFDVINSSQSDVEIMDLIYNEENPYLEYSFTYENGNSLQVGDLLKGGETKHLKYRVLWKNPIETDQYELDSSFYINYEQVI